MYVLIEMNCRSVAENPFAYEMPRGSGAVPREFLQRNKENWRILGKIRIFPDIKNADSSYFLFATNFPHHYIVG